MGQYGVGAFRKAAEEGNVAEGCFFCGQIAGMVSKIQPAAEIIAEVMADAEKLMKGSVIWEK